MYIYWDVASCNEMKINRCFSDAYCSIMEAASTSEKSSSFHQTTLRKIPEDSHLCNRRRKNLKPRLVIFVSPNYF